MSIFVGLRFDEETTQILSDWVNYCSKYPDFAPYFGDDGRIFQPSAKVNICIPLVYCNSPTPDERVRDFKPRGPLNETIEMINPHVRFIGERGTVVLGFTSEYVTSRYDELCCQGFKRRNGKYLPRVIISHRSQFSSDKWVRKLPIRSLKVIEEFSNPFDLNFPQYAHLRGTKTQ